MTDSVTAKDVGFPEKPGEYCVDGVVFEVCSRHISEWLATPGAAFRTIKQYRINDDRTRFVLGTLAADQA